MFAIPTADVCRWLQLLRFHGDWREIVDRLKCGLECGGEAVGQGLCLGRAGMERPLEPAADVGSDCMSGRKRCK